MRNLLLIVFQFELGDKVGKHLFPWITIHAVLEGVQQEKLEAWLLFCKQPRQPRPILPNKINELMLVYKRFRLSYL